MKTSTPQTLSGAFTHAAVGVTVTDLDGRFLEVNDSFCRLTGYSIDELKGTNSVSITHPDHRGRNLDLVSELIDGNVPGLVVQKGYLTKEGGLVWVQDSVSVIRNDRGQPVKLFSISEDITQHKFAQNALRESEERFRVQFKATPVPIFSWRRVDDDFVLADYNDAADRMTEHGIVELLGCRASQLYVNTPAALEGMNSCLKQKTTIRKTGEFRLLSTGELKQLDVSFVFVPPDLVMIHTEDITERVNAEQARLEAERKYREMFENANEGMFQTTPDGRYITVNPALARIMGFCSPAELMQERTNIAKQEYVDAERREEFKRRLELHGVVRGFEHEAYRKDGTRIWISESVRVVRDSKGLINFYEGIAEDITERRQSLDAVRKQKELLQTIFDHIPVMISFIDQKSGLQLVNHEWEDTIGWTSEDVLTKQVDVIAECYPDPSERRKVLDAIAAGTGEWKDFCTRVRDGRIIDTVWANVNVGDGISLGIGKDVTQGKRAERFRDAAAALSHGLSGVTSPREAAILITEIADQLIGWDSCSLQLYDNNTDTVQSVLAMDNMGGERRDVTPFTSGPPSLKCRAVIEHGQQLMVRDMPLSFEATAVPFGDKSRPSASIMTVPIQYGSSVLGVLSIQSYDSSAYDETSLKDLQSLATLCGEALNRIRAEQSLFESEERFRQIAENIEDVIWVIDTSHKNLLYINPSYEAIWSQPLQSVYEYPKSYLASVHPDDQQRVAQLMAERLTNGGYSRFEYRLLRSDGSIRWIRSRSFPIRDAEGKTYRVAGVAEDITERKISETALRDYSRRLMDAQESERKQIARELHDEIGQVLTAVRMNLQSLEPLCETRESLGKVGEGIRVIDEALKRVSDLSFELRPSLLDDLGLAAATRWYVDRFARRAGLKAEVQIDFESSTTRLSREVETACFRILQESLTNVARHAHAEHISVLLGIVNSTLQLSVKDDGVGMEPDSLQSSNPQKSTLGLRGMEERALAVEGQLTIVSAHSQGTEVRGSFPALEQPSRFFTVGRG